MADELFNTGMTEREFVTRDVKPDYAALEEFGRNVAAKLDRMFLDAIIKSYDDPDGLVVIE